MQWLSLFLEGCAGFKYDFKFDKELKDEDFVYKQANEILFAIDGLSLKLVQGSSIDFEQVMIRSTFYV